MRTEGAIELQKAPNWWSCLPTSFAMILELPVRELLKSIGHDGSEIVFPGMEEPYSRRAFHVQEFIRPCLDHGYALVIVEASPVTGCHLSFRNYPIEFSEGNWPRILKILCQYRGVLSGDKNGKPHAVAWDRQFCYDPNGEVYRLNAFQIREFYALFPTHKQSME